LRTRDRENLLWLAHQALTCDRFDEAESLYRGGLSLWADDPNIQLGLAVCLQLKGDLPGAEQQYDTILATEPKLLHALANRAELYLQTHRPNEARADLEVALKVSPRIIRKAGLTIRLAKLLELATNDLTL
jgi:tetratricopeptide (TPR) repeat protein